MAKKKEIQVSLFSFLDILSGVIGTFALIIVGMAVISIEGAPQVVEIAAGKESQRLPYFVETRPDEVWMHAIDDGDHKIHKVPLAEVEPPQGKWKELLEMLQARPEQRFMVILVRPNALPCFEKIRRVAEDYRLAIGYDAVYDAGEVEFDDEKLKAMPAAAAKALGVPEAQP